MPDAPIPAAGNEAALGGEHPTAAAIRAQASGPGDMTDRSVTVIADLTRALKDVRQVNADGARGLIALGVPKTLVARRAGYKSVNGLDKHLATYPARDYRNGGPAGDHNNN